MEIPALSLISEERISVFHHRAWWYLWVCYRCPLITWAFFSYPCFWGGFVTWIVLDLVKSFLNQLIWSQHFYLLLQPFKDISDILNFIFIFNGLSKTFPRYYFAPMSICMFSIKALFLNFTQNLLKFSKYLIQGKFKVNLNTLKL